MVLKKFVIIVAAGAGKRFSNTVPKQFELLQGKPILMYSIEAFFEAAPDIQIIVVIPKDFIDHWKELCSTYNFNMPHQVIEGGPERFHSVKNGVALIQNDGLVAVHDGARPLISQEIIKNAWRMAENYGTAIPAIEISDSVRTVEGGINRPANRKKLRLVQTPQVFKCSILKKAYQQQYDPSFTDDATVVEASGEKINLIEGSIENIKVTRAHDLIIAEALLKARN
jgi:2-C-methyl-D-erythritol 4-phosphate cytidylyltransferase